ncbi:unnamed protein product [Prorocentrum cordatum]|uniref:Secreted protein n=1 Tax=Prorocentrum cordatum TaxID=2364126 RepID=A0ABN9TER1_9DINO|nr:unnamed protein product [Polarella glacialis]
MTLYMLMATLMLLHAWNWVLTAQLFRLLPLMDIWLLHPPLVMLSESQAFRLRLKLGLRPFGTSATTPFRACLKLSFPVFVSLWKKLSEARAKLSQRPYAPILNRW